jgi:glycosyltransferase involved in cell wall biosynthesis
MIQKKVAAIIPALNEEKNIGRVLKVLLDSKEIDEVIVVDGGSKDNTAKVSQELGAKVVNLQDRSGGKGIAMKEGIKSTKADIILFCDADLIGFSRHHILKLVEPILKNEAVMAVGIRERGGWGKIAEFLIKISPIFAIAGERALKRDIFEQLPRHKIEGFMIETALNRYCQKNNLKVIYVKLTGVRQVIKEKKWGFKEGFKQRLKLIWQVSKAWFNI